MKKTRIVRLLPTLDFGGVESRAALQSELYDRSSFDLRICTFHRDGAAAEAIRKLDVPVDVLGQDPAVRNPKATLALARYLAQQRPDVLHASIVEANFHTLARPPSFAPTRFIVEEVGSPTHGWLARLAFGALYRRADRIVGVSRATCDYLAEVDHAPRSKVRLIYNCAAQRYFSASEPGRQWSAERRRAGKPFRFLLVGRLVEVKNHVTILRALAQVRQQHPHVELHLAGEGPLRAELEALSAELGLRDNVRFLGFTSEVRQLLLDADVFLLPSLSEGCSISLVESMATGLPALGSAVPGIVEVLSELAPEWTLPAMDVAAWAKRLTHLAAREPSSLDEVGKVAQRIAFEKFSPSAYISTVERLYRELASVKPGIFADWSARAGHV
jgi:glycosyltransferase involved in cell wall biosynthesis